jgi:putative transposase
MLTELPDGESSNDDAGSGRSLLDEIVRDGARQMLAATLKAEVAADVDQFVDQRDEDGRRLVVRNGYHQQRHVLTAASAVAVTQPGRRHRSCQPVPGQPPETLQTVRLYLSFLSC